MHKRFYTEDIDKIKENWQDVSQDKMNLYIKQYIEAGFSDDNISELWINLAKVILPRLKRYRELATKKVVIDFPLDEMIRAFEILEMIDYDSWQLLEECHPENKALIEEYSKGMKAFAENFLYLWF